jgi:hypothetical protein
MNSIIKYIFGYIPYGNDILHAIHNKMFYSDSVYSDENYLDNNDLESANNNTSKYDISVSSDEYNNKFNNECRIFTLIRNNCLGGTVAFPANEEAFM